MEVITIESVKKAYGAGKFRLDNINMKVGQGDFAAIIGPQGAGKTSLLHIITGRETADGGKLLFYGQNIKKLQEDAWRYITWIPDGILQYKNRSVKRIFERTISWTGMGTIQKAQELCQRFSIDIESRVSELSQEQKKCVLFINAVFTEPRLVCIDELYHETDERTYLMMLEILTGLCRKGAAVIASFNEYKKVGGYCDYFMLLDKGNCAAQGNIATDYMPPKRISMNLKTCFKDTVNEREWEEYIRLFLHDCRELAGDRLVTRENYLFFSYNGDLTALSRLLYQYGCEDYLVEQMTMEEDFTKSYERWRG